MKFAHDPVLPIVRQIMRCACCSKVTLPDIMSKPNSHLLLAHRAAHVGMFSIVAPIHVRAILAAGHACVPLDPLDLKLILAVGLRAS